MNKYLVCINIVLKEGSLITSVVVEIEKITEQNINNLKHQCMNQLDYTVLDIGILAFSKLDN